MYLEFDSRINLSVEQVKDFLTKPHKHKFTRFKHYARMLIVEDIEDFATWITQGNGDYSCLQDGFDFSHSTFHEENRGFHIDITRSGLATDFFSTTWDGNNYWEAAFSCLIYKSGSIVERSSSEGAAPCNHELATDEKDGSVSFSWVNQDY